MFSFMNGKANFHLFCGRGDRYGGNYLAFLKGMESRLRPNLGLDDHFYSIHA